MADAEPPFEIPDDPPHPQAVAPRIVLHAGFHKTGTSSLQKALISHRADLADRFVISTRATDKALTEAAEAARAFSERQGPMRRMALVTRLYTWVGSLDLAPGQGLLISTEDLSGHMPGHKLVKSYAAAPEIARLTAEALLARFGAGTDLRLLYTTRAPEEWLRSIHWQLARHPEMKAFVEQFGRLYAPASNLDLVVDAVRRELPGVRVEAVRLEAVKDRRLGPVEALYDLAGLSAADQARLRRVGPANQSPLYDLSGAFVALNRARIPREVLRRLKLALLASAELDREDAD
jgi:hypothetical protein